MPPIREASRFRLVAQQTFIASGNITYGLSKQSAISVAFRVDLGRRWKTA